MKRVDKVLGQYYSDLDCRSNKNRASYLKTYYKNKYAKSSRENDEEYLERVLVRKSESASEYKSRVELMKKYVQSVDWSKVTIDTSSSKGFSIQSKSSTQTRDLSCDKKVRRLTCFIMLEDLNSCILFIIPPLNMFQTAHKLNGSL